jgi:hypothetical protein
MEKPIIRHYPTYISKIQNIEYPNRTNKKIVDTFKVLLTDKEYNDNYKKWLSGINYETKSKNKIKIGGYLHIKLGEKFILKHIVNYTDYRNGDLSRYSYNTIDILFKDINSINWDSYFLETEQIYNDINQENYIINKNNHKIIEYNNKIDDVIRNINLLEKWEQYILFEEMPYGIPYMYKDIHRENNCFGLIKEDYYVSCRCHRCEDWGGCSDPTGTQYYKCEKCDYKYSK